MSRSTDATTTAIRPATRDDLGAILQLLADAALPTEGVAEIVNADPDHFFVAEGWGPDRMIVGVAGLEVRGGDALLRSVAVQSEWRSRDVGRALVRRIVCHAEERGIQAVYLLTMTAEHYFPRFGFHTIGRGAVPNEIAETVEFKSACPASATAMVKALSVGQPSAVRVAGPPAAALDGR